MPFIHHGNELPADTTMPEAREVLVDGCDDCLYEAWERMTDGGCGVRPISLESGIAHPFGRRGPMWWEGCMTLSVPESAIVTR